MNTTSRESDSKTDERIDKLADQLSTLVEIVSKKVVTPAPVKAVEETCVTCGGAHSWYNCPATDNNQASVCATTGTYNQVNPLNRVSNQMEPPGFAPVQNNGQNRFSQNQDQATRYSSTNDKSVNRLDIIDAVCEEYAPELLGFSNFSGATPPDVASEDICLIKKLLNNDPFQLPPMDLKQSEVTEAKSLIEEPSELELKDLPSHLEYAYLEENDKLPVIIAKGFIKNDEKMLSLKCLLSINGPLLGKSPTSRVSPVHCVPKICGITVVANEENELILTCLVTGWRVWYFQIPIDPQDQEKTTFTCPYGTFAYRRMPFGLCNAPGTFQRCMMAIFHDMIEKTMEVFIDDFLVFGDSFDSCLSNLEKMLKRRELVDRAKVDVIAKLPHPTTVKGVRSFLGHAGFYRHFIQDFSKIARPMTHLLEKETPFVFSKDCIDAFQTLKKKLTEAPILVVPDWNLPFEYGDVRVSAIGAVLGQLKTKHFQPIHYANKTMTEGQIHYTTTEKEMFASAHAGIKYIQLSADYLSKRLKKALPSNDVE
ncbi:reverse transcriptase domain-containing protein [Tanacetum coccineum]